MNNGYDQGGVMRLRRFGIARIIFREEADMKRRDVLQTAAGAAMLSLVQGQVMAAQTGTKAPATEAEEILARLVNNDIPKAVSFDARMRTLISIASLTALGDARVLADVIDAGLAEGVEPLAMREAMVQAMAYSGLPSTIRAQEVLADILKRRGRNFPSEAAATVTDATRFADGLKVQKAIFGAAIDAMHKNARADERALTVDLLTGYCFGDTYTRKGLALKERELLTFVVIASMGGCEPQVKAHAAGNIAVGTTRGELIDAIVVMLPFIGFPKSLNALAMVNEAAPAK